MEAKPRGTVIFLNGTSSAGKTTLAMALQEKLNAPFQHMALDQFRDGLPAKYRGLNSPAGTQGHRGLNVVPVSPENGEPYTAIVFGDDGKRLLRGMRRSIACMAGEGLNIVIDDILLEPEFLDDYLKVMVGVELYFVAVRCPLEVIAQREAGRPGRFPGTAMGHLDICHQHKIYDIEVDTARDTPSTCADKVIARMNEGPPTAFDILRASG